MMHHVPNSQHCPLCSVQQLAKAMHAKQTPHERALAEERKKWNNCKWWAVAEGTPRMLRVLTCPPVLRSN